MAKNIFYRLFGLRKVPKDKRIKFKQEGIVFDEEGTSCALAYRNFRGTHRSSRHGWQSGVAGTFVITKRSFYVNLPYMIICEIPIEKAVQYIELDLKGPQKLVMKFRVEKLFKQSTGELTCYWRTENFLAIMNYVNELRSSALKR